MNGQLAEREATTQQVGEVASVSDSVAYYIAKGRAENTWRGYRTDWQDFTGWCWVEGREAMPASAETVADYVAELAQTYKPATITRRLSAIAAAHQVKGLPSPTTDAKVRGVMQGIRREAAEAGIVQTQKRPLRLEDVQTIVRDHLPEGPAGARDRALLLVGFAGAFRRSELVGINVEHLRFTPEGVVVTLPKSKTDQEGAGRLVPLPYSRNGQETCPVRALQAWLELAGITSGPVFRKVDRWGHVAATRLTDKAVALQVKRYADALGYRAADFGGHSLRAGFATSAAAAGIEERAIMGQTGHRSTGMVRRYIREGSLWRNNPVAALGL